jgi:hypothetical protein
MLRPYDMRATERGTVKAHSLAHDGAEGELLPYEMPARRNVKE